MKFKYLGKSLGNQNFSRDEVNSSLEPGNARYHSVQDILSSSLVPKNAKIEVYIIIILSVVLCGSLTLREENTLKVF